MIITLADGYTIDALDSEVELKNEEIKALGELYTKSKEEINIITDEDGLSKEEIKVIKYIPEEDKKVFADDFRQIFGIEKKHG